MATKNTYVKVRINDELKADVNKIFARIGINASDAINLFYNYVKLNNGLPFEVKIPNKETLKAMQDSENDINMTKCIDVEDLFNKLEI